MDWDQNGRKDLILGEYDGYVRVYLNTNSDACPVFGSVGYVTVGGATFDGGSCATPDVADWNLDGAKDVLCGNFDGYVYILINTNNNATPRFAAAVQASHGTTSLDVGNRAHPVLFDWDRDGRRDLLVGTVAGTVQWFANTNADAAPKFAAGVNLQAGGITLDVGDNARPEVVDWDADGCEDLIVGGADGQVRWYRATPLLYLTVPGNVTEGAGVLADAGCVTVSSPPPSDLMLTLESSDTNKVSVPSSVTILAGQTSAVFSVTVYDDARLDGSQTVTVLAQAPGFGQARRRIVVDDTETATLGIFLPATVQEGGAMPSGTGVVTVSAAPDNDVLVRILSSDTQELWHAQAVILAGRTNASFELVVEDEGKIDGNKAVMVTAQVPNWISASGTVSVIDNENRALTLTLPVPVGEGDGAIVNGGRVRISGTLPIDLGIDLFCDDTTEAVVPASVTIPAGTTSVYFTVTIEDDSVYDGVQTARIGASAAEFTAASGTVQVADSEVSGFVFAAVGTTQLGRVAFPVSITARDINSAMSWYGGTATLSAAGDHGAVLLSTTNILFADGVWNGNVSAAMLDTNVRILVNDGAGHAGTSGAFRVTFGSAAHFVWEPVAGPRYGGHPFPVVLRADDPNGYHVTSFSDPVLLSGWAGRQRDAIGIGTGGWSYPLAAYYHDARTQVIYLQTELGTARTLTDLALDVTAIPGQVLNRWTIRMQHTTWSTYSVNAWVSNGWTVVYQSDESIVSNGWNRFRFSTPFPYNGTSNLLVDFSFNNSTYTTDGMCRYTSRTGFRSFIFRTDSGYGDPLTWAGATPTPSASGYVPNLQLGSGRSVSICPTNSLDFAGGVWSGSMTVQETCTNLTLTAGRGSAWGESDPFDVLSNVCDDDGDGLVDAWEADFGSTNLFRADADTDGDGATDGDEFVAGTVPTNPASAFRIEATGSGDTSTLHFDGQSGRTYAVEYKLDLVTGTWQALPGVQVTPLAPGACSLAPTNDAAGCFYRLKVQRAP